MKKNNREEVKNRLLDFYDKRGTKSVIASVLCILAGIIVGFIIMLLLSIISENNSVSDAFKGLTIIIAGPFSSGSAKYIATNFGDMIFYSVPLILTGLSVAIAFKTGLFNIGAPGQYLMGATGALLVALNIKAGSPFGAFMVWLLAIVVGIIMAAFWGAIPGMFKAFFNVNEVIVCIMTNWIAANMVSWIFSVNPDIINISSGKSGYLITTSVTGASTPTLGLNKLFAGSYIDAGIFIAIAIAVLVNIIMNKTTFGYELKACGHNKNASKYAGMNEKRNIILSMVIAGGLAGLGGALYYLNPGIEFNYRSAYISLPSQGFNGIPVALLASSNPIGVIFSGIFMRYLAQGGDNLTSANFNRYVADIIIALIIYFAGFSKLIIELLVKRAEKRAEEKAEKVKAAVVTGDIKQNENGEEK